MTQHCSYTGISDSIWSLIIWYIDQCFPCNCFASYRPCKFHFSLRFYLFWRSLLDLELENVFINIVIRYTQRLHILFFFTFIIKTLFLFFEMKFILSKFTVHSRIEFNIKDSIHVFWTQCEEVVRQWIKRLHQLFHKLLVHFISQVHVLNRCNTCEFLVTEWCRASTVAPGSYGCSSYIQLPNLHGSTEWSNINKVRSHIL